jgi:hypothetical protein
LHGVTGWRWTFAAPSALDMDQNQVLLGIVAIAIVAFVYRAVSAHCRRAPGRRPWLVAASIVALLLVPRLMPWVDRMSPSLRESPAGLLVMLPKLAAVGLLALGAIGTLLGALFPWRASDTDVAA